MWQSRQLLELMEEYEEDKGGRKCFKEHVRVRRIVNFVVIVCPMETLSEKSERSDRYKLRSVGFCDLRHNLSAALSLERCSRRTSDSQGAEGLTWKIRGRKYLNKTLVFGDEF